MPNESRPPSGLDPRACEEHRDGGGRADEQILLERDQVAKVFGISRSHVSKLFASGQLPRPRRLGKSVRWDRAELAAWSAAGCPPRDTWEAMRKGGRP